MNSSLTVYGVRKHLSVDHPVGHVEDVASQTPRRLLVWMEDRLPRDAEAHQHHEHDDHEVQHVNHLDAHVHLGRDKEMDRLGRSCVL